MGIFMSSKDDSQTERGLFLLQLRLVYKGLLKRFLNYQYFQKILTLSN